MSSRIDRREDVNPKGCEREYGDVGFADPTNKKYPIDGARPGGLELYQPGTNAVGASVRRPK